MSETSSSPGFCALMAQLNAERARPPFPREAQLAYAAKHAAAARQFTDFAEESDIEIAGRARMQMRNSLLHEAVCTASRDRICLLVVEKRALHQALTRIETFLAGFEGDETQRELIHDLLAATRDALTLAERDL